MCNKKGVVKKVYEDILKDKKTFATLKSELSLKSQLDEAFICKHILPLAKKVDPEITWQDILAYEKEALSQPTELTLNDLENISGGKASNVLMSFGLLALMGFSGLAASNVASADFIPFSETKEVQEYRAFKENPSPTEEDKKKFEFVDLGEVPFYLQADHMVDGLLWFRSPDEDKAFFVMDRKFESKNAVYTYSSEAPSQLNLAEKSIKKPSFEEIQKQEFKLFNITELKGYLQESFYDADETKFNSETHANSQTLQLADDNPLYNFSRFFNENFTFKDESRGNFKDNVYMNIGIKEGDAIKSFSLNEIISAGTPQTTDHKENSSRKKQQEKSAKKAISSRASFDAVDWNEPIRRNQKLREFAEKLKESLLKDISWKIAHRTKIRESEKPNFTTIESAKTLTENKITEESNTQNDDFKFLRNTGFTFFTLQPRTDKKSIPSFLQYEDLSEAVFDFEDIPLASCSTDMLDATSKSKVACFNGTSEEIKEQLVVHYVNKYIMRHAKTLPNELEKAEGKEDTLKNHVEKIKNMMNAAALEVRIPTHVAVDKWEKVELE